MIDDDLPDPLVDLQELTYAGVPPLWPPGNPRAAVGAVSVVTHPKPPRRDAAGRVVVGAIAFEDGDAVELEAASSPRFLELEL